MATQKQRRRRAKEKRHEYDLVEIDAEGNETVLSASTLKEQEPKKQARGSDSTRAKRSRGVPTPPSWQRVAKRAAIFGPIFFAVVMLLGGGKVTIAGGLLNTLFLLVVFIPFSYFMDALIWRQHVKRNPGAANR
jgi:hypothetical protein